ncbi:UDP-glucose dehydrogenase family protein [Chloroflexota bacterium]
MLVEKISIVGIGKLGLCTAACFASKGYQVIGVDVNQSTIAAVNEGRSPIYEPGLGELIIKCQGRLSATDDYKYAIRNSEVTFVIVPTPSQDDGSFSTKYVEVAVQNIAATLKEKKAFHVVVVTSTVMPGATEGVIKPIFEEVSGKKSGVDFGLCYNPEFVALGSAIRDFTNQDMVLIGESDTQPGDILTEIYRTTCSNNPYIARMSIHNAELAKISLNAYVTMKISFANTLAELCERFPGGDVDAVTKALGADSRIGEKYLTGAVSYGGPCFPRDNKAFVSFAKELGCKARLSQATDEVNEDQAGRIIHMAKQEIGELGNANIAILGVTYKPSTDVIEVSASIDIARALLEQGAKVRIYDPVGMENARKLLGDSVTYASSIDECLHDVTLCIMATPWPEFRKLKPDDFIKKMKRPVLIDCWRVYDWAEFSTKLSYHAIGLNNRP